MNVDTSYHAYYAPRLFWLMGHDCWATAATYSGWVYVFHWLTLCHMTRRVALPVGYSTGFLTSFLTALVTALFCYLARKYVEAPMEPFRKPF